MRKLLTAIGRFVVGLFCRVGRFGIFSWTLLMRLGGARLSHVVQQIHFIGNYSLLIIAVSGLFVGFVLGLQGYYVLVTYGSEQALGTMVALSLVRELGPAVTALLFAGRAGTALTAEIGLMRAGEQLAAMEMMGVDPVRRVLAPRFIGAFVAMPVLATIFSAVGIMGAWFVGVEMIGTDGGAFWSQMQSAVDVWHDIGNGFIKSVVFGVAVALVALFNGYAARPTPEGVSRATTSTVVVASVTSVSRPPMTPARATARSGVAMTVMSGTSWRSSPSSVVRRSPSAAARTTICATPSAFLSLSRSKACSGWPNRNRM